MALGIEMEKKRKAVQMSAAAVSFFLDREGHQKFLRTTTNQELQCEHAKLQRENKKLESTVARLELENKELKSEMEDRDLLNENVRNQERMFAGATPQDMRDLFWD